MFKNTFQSGFLSILCATRYDAGTVRAFAMRAVLAPVGVGGVVVCVAGLVAGVGRPSE